jgi:mannose-6-phosphate isomerase
MHEHRDQLLRLPPNRVWRTYTGGRLLDEIEGRAMPSDGPYPEDWIGSTVRAINPGNHPTDEGMADVVFGATTSRLADLIAKDPEYFLGKPHIARFGANPMVLVKYLDAAVRLPFQVHPTVDFSRRFLNTSSGKTEAYYILSTRPEVERPYIYLGFQRPPTRDQLRQMIVDQDIRAMQHCFDQIPVKPNDVFIVPGGLPHAIGEGVLMVEVMEPTDLVARIEFKVDGRVIPEPARFMGRDVDFALDMFSFTPMPVSAIDSRWRCRAAVLDSEPGILRESLVDQRVTDRFRILRTTLTASARWRPRGFTLLLIVEGSCVVKTKTQEVRLVQFDRIVVPCGMETIQIEPEEKVVLLECLSPDAVQMADGAKP